MAALRKPAVDRPRHREHLAPLLTGEPGRDQRPGAIGRLDDHRAERQPGDDPVALRKRAGMRGGERRRFADQGPVGDHLEGQLVVLRRVDIQHAAAEDGDRPAAGGDGATVRGCVDPAGQAAGDGVPGAGEPAGELLGDSPPVGIGMARADDRHGECIGRHKGPAHKEDRRRIGDRGEEPRVVGIPFEDDLHVLALTEAERFVGKPPVGVLANRSGYFCTDAIDPLERRSRGGKDGRGRAERGEEHPMNPSADPLHAGKVDAIAERSLPSGQVIGCGGVVSDVGEVVGLVRLVSFVGLVHERVGRHEKAPPMTSADRPRQRCGGSERLYRCSPRGGGRQRTGRGQQIQT